MKIVVRRHAAEYQVFRAIAIAQAAADVAGEGAEVFLECFDRHARILQLAPSIKWKNPHHPFEVTERKNEKPELTRPGGKIYDEVIDVEADSPLEVEWMASGLPWWRFLVAKAQNSGELGAKLKIADFPTITNAASQYKKAPPYIVIAPLSPVADMRQVNVNKIEAYARSLFPECAVGWISPDNAFLGEGRHVLNYATFPSLAGILANAQAVFAVNGVVSAMAQSFLPDGSRLVKRYCHVRGTFAAASKDIFVKHAAGMETVTDRGPGEPACGIVAQAGKDLDIQVIRPLPTD